MPVPDPAEAGIRACVVGSVNVDLFLMVDELPARGETVLGRGTTRAIGGKGANQAVAMARLGGTVSFIGAIGEDDEGRAAAAAIEGAGVDLGGLQRVPGIPTGLAAITLDAHGENTIVVTAGANAECTPGVIEAEAARIDAADVLVAQLEVPLETVVEAFGRANPERTLRVLNAAPVRALPDELLRNVDVLIVNEGEAAHLSGHRRAEDAAFALLERGPSLVAVTLGSRGSLAFEAGGEGHHAPATKVDPIDTVGAGDAFVGCFSMLRAAGASVADSLRAANTAAALSTLVPGAQAGLPTWAQVEAALESSAPGRD